jgi:hypothetical protein
MVATGRGGDNHCHHLQSPQCHHHHVKAKVWLHGSVLVVATNNLLQATAPAPLLWWVATRSLLSSCPGQGQAPLWSAAVHGWLPHHVDGNKISCIVRLTVPRATASMLSLWWVATQSLRSSPPLRSLLGPPFCPGEGAGE